MDRFQALLADGTIQATDPVWTETMPEWAPANSIPSLSAFLPAGTTAPQPLPYAKAQPTRRPTSVTVIAIIGIIFASWYLLASLFAVITVIRYRQMGVSFPVALNVASTAMGFGFGSLLFASSIAALKLIPWGRIGLVAFAAMTVVVTFVSVAITFNNYGASSPVFHDRAILAIYAGYLAFPVFIAIFMTRPHVIAAFRSRQEQ